MAITGWIVGHPAPTAGIVGIRMLPIGFVIFEPRSNELARFLPIGGEWSVPVFRPVVFLKWLLCAQHAPSNETAQDEEETARRRMKDLNPIKDSTASVSSRHFESES